MTYATLREECANLLKTATELERKARDDATFSQDPEFEKLKGRCREQLLSINSLISC